MNQQKSLMLNEEQQLAADGFFQFLFSKETELIISGPGGVGKTFLMGVLIDDIMPRYQDTCRMMDIPAEYDSVIMTATTNKAAEVLANATNRPTQTIHSFLNLKVTDDYSTGNSVLTKTLKWTVHRNMIIFVDESSMIDKPLMDMIREGTHNCKIIYVGDHCQLAPVKEPISPIYRRNLPFYHLTEPMRNKGQPALVKICQQLRNTVETGEFKDIQLVPGVIEHLDEDQMEQEIEQNFMHESNSRILAYTNQRVVDYNDYIRNMRKIPDIYVKDEHLINNNAIQFKDGMMSVEEEIKLIWLHDRTELVEIEPRVELEVRRANLQTKYGNVHYGVPLPEDKNHFTALVKYYQKQKMWKKYFELKNTYPDLRQRDSATVHKAQGSTYDTVFIDLGNLSTCHNPNQAARLLYVAFTRAKNRVVLYGDLAAKYGSIIQ